MSTPEVEAAPVSQSRSGLSLIWLLPLVAALIGAVLIMRHVLNTGPEITILFKTAEGLTVGKTEVRYKEFTVGRVTNIDLIDDASRVSVAVRLDKSASEFAAADARYWVTRPQVGLGGVTGLGTLVSGAYIGVDRGESQETASEFVGLESPPLVMRGDSGRTVRLKARDLGSLDIGSPVYYRKLKAGRVVGFHLASDAESIDLSLFIDAPYDKLIRRNTRFWNASGLDFSVDAGGVQVNSQSLLTIIAGGISFGLPDSKDAGTVLTDSETSGNLAPAPEKTVFSLFDGREQAFEPPDGPSVTMQMVFDNTVRGLARNSTVEFLGVNVGSVTGTRLSYEPDGQRFGSVVTAVIYPERLGEVQEQLIQSASDAGNPEALVLKTLVDRGLRAQLRSGNLLTGQLYVSLDFHPDASPARLQTIAANAYLIPTIPSTLDQLEPQITQIVKRLNQIDIDKIGNELNMTLQELQAALKEGKVAMQSASKTFKSARGALGSLSAESKQTLNSLQETIAQTRRNLLASDAPVQRNLNETLTQLQRASQSLRALADFLQRHPESLLRGKQADQPLN